MRGARFWTLSTSSLRYFGTAWWKTGEQYSNTRLMVVQQKLTMSVDGTPALWSNTRKYNRLLAFLMASLTWLFQMRSQEIVRPKILALSTTESFDWLTSRRSKVYLFLLKSIRSSLHLSALSCIEFFLDQSSTRLTAFWVLSWGKIWEEVVSSAYDQVLISWLARQTTLWFLLGLVWYNYGNGCVVYILPGANIGDDKIVYHQQEQPWPQFGTLRDPGRRYGTPLWGPVQWKLDALILVF